MQKNITITRIWIIVKAVPIAAICAIGVVVAFWSLYAWTGHYDMNTLWFWMSVVLFAIITWGLSKDQLECLNWEIREREGKGE